MKRTRLGIDRITVEELGDNDAIIVKISKASIQNFSNDYLAEGTGDKKVVLCFEEFGAAEYVLNATSFRALADRYGNDQRNGFQSWIGKTCVLEKVETQDPRSGDNITSVWVARPHSWEEAMSTLAETEAPAADTVPRKKRVARKKK